MCIKFLRCKPIYLLTVAANILYLMIKGKIFYNNPRRAHIQVFRHKSYCLFASSKKVVSRPLSVVSRPLYRQHIGSDSSCPLHPPPSPPPCVPPPATPCSEGRFWRGEGPGRRLGARRSTTSPLYLLLWLHPAVTAQSSALLLPRLSLCT